MTTKAPLNNQSSALIDLLKEELTDITLDRLILIESNVNNLIAERKTALKSDAIKAIKKMIKDLNLNAEDCAAILPTANAPVVVETKAKRKTKEKPEFTFVYLKDGVATNLKAAATGNKPQAFKDYLAETGKTLVDIVIPEDKERLVNHLASKK